MGVEEVTAVHRIHFEALLNRIGTGVTLDRGLIESNLRNDDRFPVKGRKTFPALVPGLTRKFAPFRCYIGYLSKQETPVRKPALSFCVGTYDCQEDEVHWWVDFMQFADGRRILSIYDCLIDTRGEMDTYTPNAFRGHACHYGKFPMVVRLFVHLLDIFPTGFPSNDRCVSRAKGQLASLLSN